MKIEITTDDTWNDRRLTLVEDHGDTLLVCIHNQDDGPRDGHTAKVRKADIIRLAKMIAVPFVDEADQ